MNRRSFLAAIPPALALSAARRPVTVLLYDARYPTARAFAARMAAPGIAAVPTTGNALPLWYGELGDLVRRGPARVTGLTAYADMVIARAWGRDHGMRLTLDMPGQPLVAWRLQPR
jgi:hypothetical protein